MQVFKSFNGNFFLVTGHTDFKGSWLSIWLKQLGATVHGLSFNIRSHFTSANLAGEVKNHRFDIREADKIDALVQKIQPDFVFHLAAQALVRSSYENPLETISTNAIGTANLLDSLKKLDNSAVTYLFNSAKSGLFRL